MILKFLDQNNLSYSKVEHPPVFTCEQAERLVPKQLGADTKNLFLRDGKGKQHFLLVVSSSKGVDLKALADLISVKGLGLASAERLKTYLGVEPGSVSLLALINDKEGAVHLLVDQDLWNAEALLCHPLVNTATLSINKESIKKFLEMTNHAPQILAIPERQ